MKGVVYLMVCLPTRKGYVGKTSGTFSKRGHDRCAEWKRSDCPLFYNAIRKYGWDSFVVFLLAKSSDKAALSNLERMWIARLGTMKPNGYNLTSGGEGTPGYSWMNNADEKQVLLASSKISKSLVDYHAGLSAEKKDTVGRNISMGQARMSSDAKVERDRKISESKIGKRQSKEHCNKKGKASRIAWAKKSVEERSAIAIKRQAARTSEERSQGIHKGWEIRRRNKFQVSTAV